MANNKTPVLILRPSRYSPRQECDLSMSIIRKRVMPKIEPFFTLLPSRYKPPKEYHRPSIEVIRKPRVNQNTTTE